MHEKYFDAIGKRAALEQVGSLTDNLPLARRQAVARLQFHAHGNLLFRNIWNLG